MAFRFLPFALLIAILTAGLWVPKGLLSFVPTCWFLSWFHLPCPGCGLTRSFMSLVRGDVLAAFKFNAAGPVLFSIFGIAAFEQARYLVNPMYQSRLSGRIGIQISSIFVLILLVQWVIKLINLIG